MKTKKTMQVLPPIKAEGDAVPVKSEAESAYFETARKLLREATGVRSDEVATMIWSQADALLPKGRGIESGLLSMRTIGEMAPGDVVEAMLAVQMIGVHNASVEFLGRSQLPDQTAGGVDTNVARATRLTRVFIGLVETREKLRGRAGRQKMTVEHVHVYKGGQAIVGPVAGGNGPAGNRGGE